jgi:hypothetical protein
MYGLRAFGPWISGKMLGQQVEGIMEIASYRFCSRKTRPVDYAGCYVLVPKMQLNDGIALVNMRSVRKHDIELGPCRSNAKQAIWIVRKLEDTQTGSKDPVRFQDGSVKDRLEAAAWPRMYDPCNKLRRTGSCGEPLGGGHVLSSSKTLRRSHQSRRTLWADSIAALNLEPQ